MTETPMQCQRCGCTTNPADPAAVLTWSMERSVGRTSWTCPGCALDNIRSLEAKLEPEWW